MLKAIRKLFRPKAKPPYVWIRKQNKPISYKELENIHNQRILETMKGQTQ